MGPATAFSMGVFLGALEYVLEEGNNKGWLEDEKIAVGVVVCDRYCRLIFFYRAFNAKFPIVDLKAFTNRNFAFGTAFSFIMGVGLYGLTYLYPVYLSAIRGYDR